MKVAAMVALLLGLSGCGMQENFRNSPQQQVEDFKICRDGGMSAYLNGYAEVRCAPPGEAKP